MASLLAHVCTPVLTTYTKPTSCSRCHSYLLGLWHQGYHCYQCSSNFHARCTNASSSKQPPNAAERQQYDTCTNCSCNRYRRTGHHCVRHHRPSSHCYSAFYVLNLNSSILMYEKSCAVIRCRLGERPLGACFYY